MVVQRRNKRRIVGDDNNNSDDDDDDDGRSVKRGVDNRLKQWALWLVPRGNRSRVSPEDSPPYKIFCFVFYERARSPLLDRNYLQPPALWSDRSLSISCLFIHHGAIRYRPVRSPACSMLSS